MGNWISVKDNIPAEKIPVLATDGFNQFVAWRERHSKPEDYDWFYSDCCGCMVKNITHWKPLEVLPDDEIKLIA